MKKLTEMWSIKENSLAEELSRKMIIMRRQDDSLSGIDAITVQTSTASAQAKLTMYEKQAMVVMQVEQAKLDDGEQTDQGAGIFQSISLDIEAALGTTNLL